MACGIAMMVAAPWSVYTFHAFPLEATFERNYALRHIREVVEEQGGPPWKYLTDMPRLFGELIALPLGWAVWTWVQKVAPPSRRKLLVWICVPYIVYSGFATKMPAYVMVAAPAIFLIEADFWLWLNEHRTAMSGARKIAVAMLMTAMVVLPARQLLEPTGPLEQRERNPEWTRDLRSLNTQIGVENAVIFNVRHTVEAMFYTPYIAYEFNPSPIQIHQLQDRGFQVYIYDESVKKAILVRPYLQ